jgi:hypothetical protein
VVRALEAPTSDYTTERQRHVAVRAAIEEGRGFAVLCAKKHQRNTEHAARQRALAQVRALTGNVPKPRKPRDRDMPLVLRRNQFFVQHLEGG